MPFLKVRQHLAQSEGFILQSLLAAGLGLASPRCIGVSRPDRPVNHGGRRTQQLGDLASIGAADSGGTHRFRRIKTPPKTGQLRPKARGQ